MEHARLDVEAKSWVGRPLGDPSPAPDPVNVPMIRHWVDALDDRNPVYLDEGRARASGFGGLVAPPAMLQTWTMPRPRIEGIAARGGSSAEPDPESPIERLAAAGYTGTVATDSELAFARYLRPGDVLESSAVFESVSERKATPLGFGYFLTWLTTWTDAGGTRVGTQRFRILKFDPSSAGAASTERSGRRPREAAVPGPAEEGAALPPFDLDVTATVIVAGAIASRDFMPVHHDSAFARAQGAPDVFMNILTTNGYVARYVTDWAGPEARLRSIAVRLGAPAVPGLPLRFRGRVASQRVGAGGRELEIALSASNDLGVHATGRVALSLPAD